VRLELTHACWLDTLEFERCLNRARAAKDTDPEQAAVALSQAVNIYAGDLLDGCYAELSRLERDYGQKAVRIRRRRGESSMEHPTDRGRMQETEGLP
jgi:Bacterial transcriptional activator domain